MNFGDAFDAFTVYPLTQAEHALLLKVASGMRNDWSVDVYELRDTRKLWEWVGDERRLTPRGKAAMDAYEKSFA